MKMLLARKYTRKSTLILANLITIAPLIAANDTWPAVTGCPSKNPTGLKAMLVHVNSSLIFFAELIGGGAYVAGLAFVVAGIMKLKQHRDNPAQVPIATPISYIFIGAFLVYLPSLITITRESIFTATTTEAGKITSLTGTSTQYGIFPSDC